MSKLSYGQQDPELRRLKEEFVSNLQGTTRWEVFCVLSSLPLCLLIAAYVESRVVARIRSSAQLSKQQLPLPKFAFEFCGVVLPLLLLLMSVAPAEPAFLLLFLLWGSLGLKLWMRAAHGPAARHHMAHMVQHISAPRKRFVSAFRGGVMLATCLAILAVDFPAFPRRYAKAEGFGGGVMDVGVGAIIFAGGLVSAVTAAAATPAATAGAAGSAAPGSSSSQSAAAAAAAGLRLWLVRLLRGVKAAVPVLLLGSGREFATAAVGYQAHLGEYGLHWNFFYTIAGVTLLTLAVPVAPRWLAPLGLGLTAAHQAALNLDVSRALGGYRTGLDSSTTSGLTGLSLWLQQLLSGLLPTGTPHDAASSISSSNVTAAVPTAAAAAAVVSQPGLKSLGAWLHADLSIEARQAAGFWASNKEGLGSLPGYWALHMLGAAVGHHLGTSCAATAVRARAQLVNAGSRPGGGAAAVGECGRLVWAWVGCWWGVDLLLWGLLAAVEGLMEPVSRRTCNLPYVLWTSAQCLAWLLLVLMADLLTAVICSSTGGCGTTTSPSTWLTPPTQHSSSGSGKSCVRRSLEVPAAAAVAPAAATLGTQHSSSSNAPDISIAAAVQPAASATGSLQRRSVGSKRSGGGGPSSPMASTAAALTAAAVGSSSTSAAGASQAAAAAVAANTSSPGSRESSPRNPPISRAAAGSNGSNGQVSPKGSSMGYSSSSSGSSTPGRTRRQSSKLQSQQQQTQQQQQPPDAAVAAAAAAGASSSGSSSSGGPMRLMLAFNRNMLSLFLIANLLTGGVNLTINTLAVGSWPARFIVGGYMLLLCGLAVGLDSAALTLKPW